LQQTKTKNQIIVMEEKDLRVGIIGTGWIAEKAAYTLQRQPGLACYAVGSRTQQKADSFAAAWNIGHAYGSYEQLIADPNVDLVYVGTPHSHHYAVTLQAIEQGKACLVEKAFMANVAESETVVSMARRQRVFLAEAIWTRYQPIVATIRQLIADGRIGEPRLYTASIGYSMGNKPRIMQPDLCGGALMDLGVYAINFVRMFSGADILQVESQCVKSDTGMDLVNAASFRLSNGALANIQSSACCVNDNQGTICGTEGYLIIDNINNPQSVKVYARDRVFVEEIKVPQQITGYEYQFLACRDALRQGLTEAPQMPLDETLYVMKVMDELRRKWGVRYPMDRR